MNQDIKTLWIKALRSDKYQQSSGCLQDAKGFCCLGVLCDLAVTAEVIPPPIQEDGHYYYIRRETDLLPPEVSTWLGIDTYSPEVILYSDEDIMSVFSDEYDPALPASAEITLLNDEFRFDFKHLADILERQV